MAASPNKGILLQNYSGELQALPSQPDADLIPLPSLPHPCPVLLAAPLTSFQDGELRFEFVPESVFVPPDLCCGGPSILQASNKLLA